MSKTSKAPRNPATTKKAKAAKPATKAKSRTPVKAGKIQAVALDAVAIPAVDTAPLKTLLPAKSVGHIKFNGSDAKPQEVYYRLVSGSPAILKAPLDTPIDAEGYRSQGAVVVCTGPDAVREQIKLATGKTPAQLKIGLPQDEPATGAATRKRKRDGLSGLDAAAQVLAASTEPLTTGQMIERMFTQGLWKTSGKTPAATIYSAILREMKTRGTDSRFIKSARGKFTVNPAAGGRA